MRVLLPLRLALIVALAVPWASAQGETVYERVARAAKNWGAERCFTPRGPGVVYQTTDEIGWGGGILVGLEIGVGPRDKGEGVTVAGVRACYSTGVQEWSAKVHGTGGPTVKSVRLLARPGYAVSGITVSHGPAVNGLSLTFMRIKDNGLDWTDTYDSEWVGDRPTGTVENYSGRGRPVVGVFSHVPAGGGRVRWFGLMYLKGTWTTAPDAKAPDPTPSPSPGLDTATAAGLNGPAPDVSPSTLETEAAALRDQKQKQQTNWLLIGSSGVAVLMSGALCVYIRRRRMRDRPVEVKMLPSTDASRSGQTTFRTPYANDQRPEWQRRLDSLE